MEVLIIVALFLLAIGEPIIMRSWTALVKNLSSALAGLVFGVALASLALGASPAKPDPALTPGAVQDRDPAGVYAPDYAREHRVQWFPAPSDEWRQHEQERREREEHEREWRERLQKEQQRHPHEVCEERGDRIVCREEWR